MEGLILFSIGSTKTKVNFTKTVLNGFEIKDIRPFLDTDKYDKINSKLYFWGCKSSVYYKRKMQKVGQGDIIAFSLNKEFIIKGKILDLIDSKEISEFLWGDNQYSNILIISEIEKISIPYSVIFNDIGYNPKAKINGLVLVDSKKLEKLASKHNEINSYLKTYAV